MTPATAPTVPSPAALLAAHLRQAARRWPGTEQYEEPPTEAARSEDR